MTEEEGGRREKRKRKKLCLFCIRPSCRPRTQKPPTCIQDIPGTHVHPVLLLVSLPPGQSPAPGPTDTARRAIPPSGQPSERLCDAIGLSRGCLRLHRPSSEASADEKFSPVSATVWQPHIPVALLVFPPRLLRLFRPSPPSIAELVARVGLTVVCLSPANNPTILQSPSGRALLARTVVRCRSLSLTSSSVVLSCSRPSLRRTSILACTVPAPAVRSHVPDPRPGLTTEPPHHLTSLPRRQTVMSPTLPSYDVAFGGCVGPRAASLCHHQRALVIRALRFAGSSSGAWACVVGYWIRMPVSSS
jgi:hypothetical protein